MPGPEFGCLSRDEPTSALCASGDEPALRTDEDQRLRTHVGPCRAARRREPRPGISPISAGRRRSSEAAAKAVIDGSNQYAPSRGTAAAARRWRRITAGSSGSSSTPEGLRDQRRDRSARRGDPRDGAAGRRGHHLHAGLRQLRADDPQGRGDAGRESRFDRPSGASSARRSSARSVRRPARSCSTIRKIPTGRLFDSDELESRRRRRARARPDRHRDEVWEHVVLDGRRFTPIATLPGMAERTIKVGSAGKIFSLTGWKVGLDRRRARARRGRRPRPPVPDLLDRAQPAGGGCVRARRGRRVDRSRCASASSARAT